VFPRPPALGNRRAWSAEQYDGNSPRNFSHFEESDEITRAPHSQNQVPRRHLLKCSRDARSRRQSLQDPRHHDSMDCRISPRLMDNSRMLDEHICCLPFCTSEYRSGTFMAKHSTEYYAAFAGLDLVQLVSECHHSVRSWPGGIGVAVGF
jgi:hypothetical protein